MKIEWSNPLPARTIVHVATLGDMKIGCAFKLEGDEFYQIDHKFPIHLCRHSEHKTIELAKAKLEADFKKFVAKLSRLIKS